MVFHVLGEESRHGLVGEEEGSTRKVSRDQINTSYILNFHIVMCQ